MSASVVLGLACVCLLVRASRIEPSFLVIFVCGSSGAHTHRTKDDGDRHVYIAYVCYNALNACYHAYNVRWNT